MADGKQVTGQRDRRSLNYLLARYGVDIRTALVRRYGAEQDGVDDAMQQAFLRFSTLKDREQVADPRAFLFVMARNALKDAIRRADSQKRRWKALAEVAPAHHELSPEEVLLQREAQDALERGIAELAPQARELLRLSRIEGLTYAEISRLTGRSPADISRTITRTLIELRHAVKARATEAA
nr:sigma-70 family RNA polymerase sigma factor [uncultured Brevundimonas sp.]